MTTDSLSGELFLLAQDASADPFMLLRPLWNESGKVSDFEWLYLNGASERLLLRPVGELAGKRLLVEMAGSPIQGLFNAFARVMERAVGFRAHSYYPGIGRETCFRLTAIRVEDSLALLATDITEARKAEKQLKDLEEQFLQAQKMETLGRLVGGVVHDFNNMLSAIMMNAHLLLKHLPEGDPGRRYSREIDVIASHAAGLTHQLLAYSGKQAPEARVLPLASVVSEVVPMLRRLIGEEIELLALLEPDAGRIRADAVQIQQVVLNLVINARDAIPVGGTITLETRSVEVTESAEDYPDTPPGRYVMLLVNDTGAGMSREIQPRVFEPHFSTKEEGSGLGLATVHRIIQKSAGRVFVSSDVGEGTTFKILFPEATEAASPVERRASPARAPGGTETILLVEDEPKLRSAIKRTLERKGYKVLEAKHGEQALRVARETDEEIHLLVADLVMPFMGGRLLAEALAPLRPEMRVLYTSGYADRNTPDPDEEAGFLMKPFTPYALAWKIREAIDDTQEAESQRGSG